MTKPAENRAKKNTPLTPDELDAIRRLRAEGASRDEIARAVGRGAGTVSRALARLADGEHVRPAAPAPVDAGPVDGALEPLSLEALSAEVAGTIAELRADAARARAANDQVALGRAQRFLSVHMAIAARLAKLAPAAEGMVLVDRAVIDQDAQRLRDSLHDLVERSLAQRETWPKCDACGQPVAPGGAA